MSAWFDSDSKDHIIDGSLNGDSKNTRKDMDFEKIAISSGMFNDAAEYRKAMHDAAMKLAKYRITASLSCKDAYVIQSVRALDDVNISFNIISERLSDWYSIHYPEYKVKHSELIKFILEHGTRDNIEVISIGAPLSGADASALRSMALTAQALFDERKALEAYISDSMKEFAPNLSDLLGPILAARFIARAGSLEKLSMTPSSTIQVMGSGEALFKHIKTGSPPPKHGLIFKHPLVSGSPKRVRGKIARMLAAKVAIAARVDYYSGEYAGIGENIREKVERIKRTTPKRDKK